MHFSLYCTVFLTVFLMYSLLYCIAFLTVFPYYNKEYIRKSTQGHQNIRNTVTVQNTIVWNTIRITVRNTIQYSKECSKEMQ